MIVDILYFLGITFVVSVVSITLKVEKPSTIFIRTLKLFAMVAGGIAAFCAIVQILQAAY